jgi:hypothetical protein
VTEAERRRCAEVIEAWNERLQVRRNPDPSPAIGVALTAGSEAIRRLFNTQGPVPNFAPRYNAAPQKFGRVRDRFELKRPVQTAPRIDLCGTGVHYQLGSVSVRLDFVQPVAARWRAGARVSAQTLPHACTFKCEAGGRFPVQSGLAVANTAGGANPELPRLCVSSLRVRPRCWR